MPVNYPERGGVDQQKPKYREGDTYTHPSGVVYQVIHGDWKVIRRPGDAPIRVEGLEDLIEVPPPPSQEPSR